MYADGLTHSVWIYPSQKERESQFLINLETAVYVKSDERIAEQDGLKVVGFHAGIIVVHQSFKRIITYQVHNRERHDVKLELYFWSKNQSDNEIPRTRDDNSYSSDQLITATKYDRLQDVGVKRLGKQLQCCNFQVETDRAVQLDMRKGERYVVVIEESFQIQNRVCVSKVGAQGIARLESNGAISGDVASILCEIFDVRRAKRRNGRIKSNNRVFRNAVKRRTRRNTLEIEAALIICDIKVDNDIKGNSINN